MPASFSQKCLPCVQGERHPPNMGRTGGGSIRGIRGAASQLWKHVSSQPIVLVAVAVMLVAAVATVVHAACMRRVLERGRGANVDALREQLVDELVREAFGATVADPSAAVVARKVRPYATSGMTQFFSSGSPADQASAASTGALFFQPTGKDVTCDFTTLTTDCAPLVDRVSCTDRTTSFPGDRTVLQAAEMATTVGGPTNSADCTVFVMDGTYTFSKTAISGFFAAWVPPGNPPNGPCYLVMPRADVATKVLMLLRPVYVRSGSSMLYYVDYNEVAKVGVQGPDGMSYTSWAPSDGSMPQQPPTAVLRLIPVNNQAIDNGSVGTQPLPQLAPPTRSGATLDSVVPPGGSSMVPLAMFYLKYAGPTSAVGGLSSGAATLYATITPGFTSTTADQNGVALVTASRTLDRPFATISVSGGGGPPMTIPTVEGGVLVVTHTGNVVVAAAFGPTRVALRRWTLGSTWLSYTKAGGADAGGNGASSADLAKQLGVYSSTCVPCLADVALRTVGMQSNVAIGVTDVDALLNARFTDTLDGSVAMVPGKYLQTSDGLYRAYFQGDGNLVILEVDGNVPQWDTRTRMQGAPAGRLSIDDVTGVATMATSSGIVYWKSTKVSGRSDVGKWRMVLEYDGADGSSNPVLRIKSSYGSVVLWKSSPTEHGVPFMLTCGDAARIYKQRHGSEPSYKTSGSAWDHYTSFGRLAGYAWSGPPGPCVSS